MSSISLANTLLLFGALLILVGVLSSLAARRFGVPLLLVFLIIGMLAGEDGPGQVAFDDFRLAYLVGSGALAVILFDGGLRTRLANFRGVLVPSMLLATVGVALTAGITGAAAAVLLGVDWLEGQLLGAIVAATDAAAVFFLLRAGGLQLRHRVGATLEIESGTNDPAAVFLTLLLVEILLAGSREPGLDLLVALARQAVLGTVMGIGGGLAITFLLNRVQLAAGLHALFAIAAAILIYALTALLGGSGFLAVYLAGLVVGNRPVRAYASIVAFHDTATWLSQIAMFLVLGLLATPSRFLAILVPGLTIAAFLMLVARPLAVLVCLAPFGFRPREVAFIGWVGLRGAVSIFLATVPMLSGLPHGSIYFDVAFFVVLVSLIVQGWSITPLARRLGLALPRTERPVRRVELDLPGQLARELVGFPVLEGSRALARDRLPGWTRLVLVVRDGQILEPREAGPLRVGDYAYLLAPPERAHRLDRLFVAGGEEQERGIAVMGEFTLEGDVRLAELADLYEVPVEPADAGRTVAELFADRFEGQPQLGDRLPFGEAELIVRELDEDRVTRAALLLEEDAVPVLGPARRLRRRLLRLVRRLRRRVRRRIRAAPTPTEQLAARVRAGDVAPPAEPDGAAAVEREGALR